MDIQNTIGLAQAPQPELRAVKVPAKSPPQVEAERKPEPTPQQVQQAVQTINRNLATSTSLEFSIDQNTKSTVVKVVDKDSGELIRQIPSSTTLAIAESIGEFQKGLLLRQEV